MRVSLPARQESGKGGHHWSLEETGRPTRSSESDRQVGGPRSDSTWQTSGAQWQGIPGMGGGRPASTGSASTPPVCHSITQTGRG